MKVRGEYFIDREGRAHWIMAVQISDELEDACDKNPALWKQIARWSNHGIMVGAA